MIKRIAVYPGTFDPVTTGHLDIVARTLPMVDHLIIAVAANSEKTPLFSLTDRVALISHEVEALFPQCSSAIEVHSFHTLLVDFAKKVEAGMIIRGLRAVSDFEYEFKMAAMNSRLAPEIETVFLMASDRYQFVSSRFVKEIARLNGDVSEFLTPNVREKIQSIYSKNFQNNE